MKSEMKRWTDEENFFGSEHVSSQIWCYLKLVRWRDEEWDEEMNRWKKNFFLVWTCIKPNLVLSEISEMKSEMKKWTDEKKIFLGSEHVSSQIWCQKFFPSSVGGGGGLKSYIQAYIHTYKQTDIHTYGHYSD